MQNVGMHNDHVADFAGQLLELRALFNETRNSTVSSVTVVGIVAPTVTLEMC